MHYTVVVPLECRPILFTGAPFFFFLPKMSETGWVVRTCTGLTLFYKRLANFVDDTDTCAVYTCKQLTYWVENRDGRSVRLSGFLKSGGGTVDPQTFATEVLRRMWSLRGVPTPSKVYI